MTWIAPGQIHDACDLHTCAYWLVAFGAEAVSLETIARAVGYADARHLQRLFRRSTGAAPRVWRRVHLAAGVRPGMAVPAMQ